MKLTNLAREIVATYRKHGWQLRRALLRPETRNELGATGDVLSDASIEESNIDALWFSRPSDKEREAWELRLLAENPYALFQTFDSNVTEDEREAIRKEMEERLLARK
jgi:hypothetical protein